MRFKVYYKYEVPVEFDADDREDAIQKVWDGMVPDPDWEDRIYMEDFDVEEAQGLYEEEDE